MRSKFLSKILPCNMKTSIIYMARLHMSCKIFPCVTLGSGHLKSTHAWMCNTWRSSLKIPPCYTHGPVLLKDLNDPPPPPPPPPLFMTFLHCCKHTCHLLNSEGILSFTLVGLLRLLLFLVGSFNSPGRHQLRQGAILIGQPWLINQKY